MEQKCQDGIFETADGALVEVVRYARDAWGQETLAGISWDLVWVFLGLGVAIVVLHGAYAAIAARRTKRA